MLTSGAARSSSSQGEPIHWSRRGCTGVAEGLEGWDLPGGSEYLGGRWGQIDGLPTWHFGFRVCCAVGKQSSNPITVADSTRPLEKPSTEPNVGKEVELGSAADILDRFPFPEGPPFVSQIEKEILPDGTVQVVPHKRLSEPASTLLASGCSGFPRGNYLGIVVDKTSGRLGEWVYRAVVYCGLQSSTQATTERLKFANRESCGR